MRTARSFLGDVYPVYHVLEAVGAFTGGRVLHTATGDREVAALAPERDGRRRMLVANLAARPRAVAIRGFGAAARIHLLADGAAAPAPAAPANAAWRAAAAELVPLTVPLRLPPYGIARIDAARR